MTGFGALVLAAGRSRRMGGPNKLLLAHRGRPLIAWAFEAAKGSRAGRIVLVTGRDGDAVAELCAFDARCARVRNDDPDRGLSSSLQLGLATMGDVDAAAVLLGDMPEIDSALLDALFDAWRDGAYAVVPESGGKIGNPAILGRAAMADCAALTGDAGARRLLAAHADALVRVPVAARAIFFDIDEPADRASS